MPAIAGTDQFSVEHPEVVRRINQIVHTFIFATEWREDFRQEALVHFTRILASRPGHTLSWYVQSCRSAIRDRLKQGKSVDSLKRHKNRYSIHSELGNEDRVVHPDLICHSNPHLETSVLDAYEVVSGQLDQQNRLILRMLFEGYGVREIARRLGVPHQAVSEGRRRIGKIALQMGIRAGGWF